MNLMQKILLSIGAAFVIVIVAGLVYTNTSTQSTKGKLVPPSSPTPTPTAYVTQFGLELITPLPNTTVTSPLEVTGRAPGSWFFEGSAPVRLVDDKGGELASGTIQAQGNWMTTDLVMFTTTLTFTNPKADNGNLILSKDNPSGRKDLDRQISIPVRFK